MPLPPPPGQEGVIYDGSHEQYVLITDTLAPPGTQSVWKIPRHKDPSILRKGTNFTKAVTKHLHNHRIKATDQQVDERFAICSNCPTGHYQPNPDELAEFFTFPFGQCSDLKCGCIVGPHQKTGRNKLRWASESCPQGHWPEISPPDTPPDSSSKPPA